MLASIKEYLQAKVRHSAEKPVMEAYDIWSGSYDEQPGNLMLDLDEEIFPLLISNISLENKIIADIGCGTGRHWQKLYNCSPALVRGYDVSVGMLNRLKRKFPLSITEQTTDNLLLGLPDGSVDCIVSTLTIAHIDDIDEAIGSWARVLRTGGDLIITDFHPAILAQGGKRSFSHDNKNFSVINYVHSLDDVKQIFSKYGFNIIQQEERYIDEPVRSYYEAKNAMTVFQKFKGMPVIYGLHLKR